MKKVILVGNGFTSHLIDSYSNKYMLDFLKYHSGDLYNRINQNFESLRKKVESFELEEQALGVCGDTICGMTPLFRPTIGIVYNQELKNHIIEELESKGFQGVEKIYNDFFVAYGLIYDTQHRDITNIESALKIVELFKTIGKFTSDDYSKIKNFANKLYYNDGNCEIENIDRGDKEKIRKFFKSFNKIFTTNYDLLIDSALSDYNVVRHLHGGYCYRSKFERSNKKLNSDESYLVWGINSEEKVDELIGAVDFSEGNTSFGTSILEKHINELRELESYELHIFGYSGENDGHINDAIKSSNINDIFYYTSPNKIRNSVLQFKVNEMFTEKGNVKLRCWDEIWDELR